MNIENRSNGPSQLIEAGALVLRLGVGLPLLFAHGWEKLIAAAGFLLQGRAWGLVDLVHSLGFPMPAFFAICAALGESVCALSVACGLFTRLMAAMTAATMVVALYTSFQLGTSLESAYLYAVPFAVLTVTGPGKFSLDRMMGKVSVFDYLRRRKG